MKTIITSLILLIVIVAISNSCVSTHTKKSKKRTESHSLDSSKQFYIVPVLYATDRKRTGKKTTLNFYGSERGKNLEYGTINISIPINHKIGEIEKPSWYQIINVDNKENYFTTLSFSVLKKQIFFEKFNQSILNNNEILVFIHGYNNTFDEAVYRTAQLKFDLGFKGAAITYSWPSGGEIKSYLKDEDNVNWTVSHLKLFLKQIAQNNYAKKINVIAHSMGNRALMIALKELSLEKSSIKLNQVILAAPDIDRDIFVKDIAPLIIRKSNKYTIYTTQNDKALLASEKVHSNLRVGNNITIVDGFQTIDVSNLDCGDFIDHACFATSRPIIDDIYKLLSIGSEPSNRNLIQSNKYWIMKK